jgi:methyltransferase (TIGR00027 family)
VRLASRLRLFEVDTPDSQRWKRARLGALRIAEPNDVVFVPLDLERQPLVDGLCAGGYHVGEPAFLSWLGTTQYLTADAVVKTLRDVAALAPRTEIVFTYQVPEGRLNELDRRVLGLLTARATAGGAPWLSSFEPAGLTAQLETLGFSAVVDFGPEQASTRYLSGRTDGLSAPPWSHLMHAVVRGGPAAR